MTGPDKLWRWIHIEMPSRDGPLQGHALVAHHPSEPVDRISLSERDREDDPPPAEGVDRMTADLHARFGDGVAFVLCGRCGTSGAVRPEGRTLPRVPALPVAAALLLDVLIQAPAGERTGGALGRRDGGHAAAVLARDGATADAGAGVILKAMAGCRREAGLGDAEWAWTVLAAGYRQARELAGTGGLSAAILGFQGRGRIWGDVRPDPLIRFGVSDWR